jgi:hypothetical protein
VLNAIAEGHQVRRTSNHKDLHNWGCLPQLRQDSQNKDTDKGIEGPSAFCCGFLSRFLAFGHLPNPGGARGK